MRIIKPEVKDACAFPGQVLSAAIVITCDDILISKAAGSLRRRLETLEEGRGL